MESSMTRRRLLLWVLPAALVLLSVGAWLLRPRPSPITEENAAKIQKGMMLTEVEALLGGPARNESAMPDNLINDAFVNADPDEIQAGRLHPGARPFEDKRWASPGFVVLVDFDDSGRVVRHSHTSFHADTPFLDKLRRWLHL
jgi:hypothetical protein